MGSNPPIPSCTSAARRDLYVTMFLDFEDCYVACRNPSTTNAYGRKVGVAAWLAASSSQKLQPILRPA